MGTRGTVKSIPEDRLSENLKEVLNPEF